MNKKNNLNENTEIGTKHDAYLATLISAKPYEQVLDKASKDWGRESSLYSALESVFIKDRVDFKRLVSILKNYDVYDDYVHLLNLNEADFIVNSPNDAQTLAGTNKLKKDDKVYIDKTAKSPISTSLSEDDGLEPEAIIEPKDKATIKYLSNIKDPSSGKVSEPFNIGAKKYQMCRGITPSKEIVMAVYCHDDFDGEGQNVIHPIDYFEENIANPMKEQMAVTSQPKIVDAPTPDQLSIDPNPTNLGLGEFKFFLVDTTTGKFRKFKTVSEIAKATMAEGEKFMTLKEFQNFFKDKVFGKHRKVSEITELPKKPDVDKALEQMVTRMGPYMTKINEPIEQVEFITKLVNMMNFDKTKIPLLLAHLKNDSNQTFDKVDTQMSQTSQVNEKKIMSKNQLEESILSAKVIKTIKIKDIK